MNCCTLRSVLLVASMLLCLTALGQQAALIPNNADTYPIGDAPPVDSITDIAGQPYIIDGEALQVSLLTCAPGQTVYYLYGHTALRVRDNRNGTDYVFNYGMFDSRKPHFIWNFLRGKTQYFLGVDTYEEFCRDYAIQRRSVNEQVLRLRPSERLFLYESLLLNARPEFRSYHYDFLYDNCVTRALQQIYLSLEGKRIVPPGQIQPLTVRSIIRQYCAAHPWLMLGQDLVLGEEVDREPAFAAQSFAPIVAARYLLTMQVEEEDGTFRSLVSRSQTAVKAIPFSDKAPAFTPRMAAWLLLIVYIALSVASLAKHRTFWGVDVPLWLLQGVAGVLVAFLFFFSEHPAVDTNWNVVWLNPLPLIWGLLLCIPFMRHRFMAVIYGIEALPPMVFVGLSAFFLQVIPLEAYIYCSILLIRCFTVLLLLKRKATTGTQV